MSVYGKTFWGKQWLNALHQIDHTNRLPRGRNYARRGSVRQLTVSGNTITARVRGTALHPYQITITVPVWSATRKRKMNKLLTTKPGWLATLLNRRLPEPLLREAVDEEITIFPSRWSDLTMDCSCPDTAVPCKHLAAVIYLIANEIDLDPFLVLSLRGYKVEQELKSELGNGIISRKIPVSTWPPEPPPETEPRPDDPEPQLETEPRPDDPEPPPETEPRPDDPEWPAVDLTRIPETGDAFLKLLPEDTPFTEWDFKPQLLGLVKSAANVKRHLPKEWPDERHVNPQRALDGAIRITGNPRAAELHLTFEDGSTTAPLWDWLITLLHIPEKQTETWPDALQLIGEYARLAFALVNRSAIMPAVYRYNGHFIIMWEPLWKNPEIKKALTALKQATPDHPLKQATPDHILKQATPDHILKLDEHEESAKESGTVAAGLISVLITEIVTRISSATSKYNAGAPVHRQFFGPGEVVTAGPETEKLAQSIQLWLKKLSITRHRFVPVVRVDDENYPDFRLSLAVRDTEAAGPSEPIPMQEFKKDPQFEEDRLPVYQNLMLLEQQFPDIAYLINYSSPHVTYNPITFEQTLLQILPVLQDLGIEVLLPKALKALVRPRPSLQAQITAPVSGRGWLELQKMLEFNWKVSIGDAFLSEEEFFSLVRGSSGIVRIRDRYVHLTGSDLEKLKKALEQPPSLSKNEQLRVLLAGEYQGAPVLFNDELKARLRQLLETRHVDLPKKLKAKLRPYQLKGYQWLYNNSRLGFGSILADDMGLGKTLQAIALIQMVKQEEGLQDHLVLVVAPASLISNWHREINRFAPDLSLFVYHGVSRDLTKRQGEDILLTSYSTLRSDGGQLKKIKWRMMIIDESQYIKNPQSRQTKAVKSMPADIKLALSGTPVENRLSEYWSVFDFVNKGLLGSAAFFNKTFAKPIEESHDRHALDLFRKVTGPFVLRRLKTDKRIITDLPDKVENNHFCTLTPGQAAMYQNVVDAVMQEISESEGIERRGLVLKLINALKQVCNHPVQYAKQGKAKPADSGKTEMLRELLETIIENREKTLIFTQFTEMAKLLKAMIHQSFGQDPLYLHGGLSRKQRDEQVEAFQHHRHRNVFIVSLKAGGTGLNLTAASHVIHYDLWWNPAVENQATDRAYRIGQDKKVMVHRLISKGTMEEKIDEMIRSKKELVDMTIASGENRIGDLDDRELQQLVELSAND